MFFFFIKMSKFFILCAWFFIFKNASFFFYFFSNRLKLRASSRVSSKFVFNYFFDYFFKKYMLQKLLNNIFIEFRHRSIFFENKNDSNYFFRSFKKYLHSFKINLFIFKNFINFFFFVFISCDSAIFLNWLKQLCEGTEIKNHKAIFSFLGFVLAHFFSRFNSYIPLRGLFFQVKGKVSGGGSSKKKKIVLSLGSFNLSTNKVRVSYCKNYVNTSSGVLGLLFFLCY